MYVVSNIEINMFVGKVRYNEKTSTLIDSGCGQSFQRRGHVPFPFPGFSPLQILHFLEVARTQTSGVRNSAVGDA